ncbi:MAG: hypothetical protein ACP5I4_02565 [Oceanipulchritudo sp.]
MFIINYLNTKIKKGTRIGKSGLADITAAPMIITHSNGEAGAGVQGAGQLTTGGNWEEIHGRNGKKAETAG